MDERDRIYRVLIDAIQIQISGYVNWDRHRNIPNHIEHREAFLNALHGLLLFGKNAFAEDRNRLLEAAFEFKTENWWVKKLPKFEEYRNYFLSL